MNKVTALETLNQLVYREDFSIPKRVFLESEIFEACAEALEYDKTVVSFDYHTYLGTVEVIKTLTGVPSHSMGLEFSGRVTL